MVRLDHVVREHLRTLGCANTSLKEAQRRVRAGEYSIAGRVATEPKAQIVPSVEEVTHSGSGGAAALGDHCFCLLHKPAGYVCQRHPREPSVYDLIPEALRRDDLVCVGRLDRDTTGTLLLGTDGGLQAMLLFPTSRVWKRYVATLEPSKPLQSDAAAAFASGLVLDDGTQCAPATLEVVVVDDDDDAAAAGASSSCAGGGGPPPRVVVTLHEGFFHAVKRMIAHVGGVVTALHRERFGLLSAEGLSPGSVRPLTRAEMESLVEMLPVERVAQKELSWQRSSSTGSSTTTSANASAAACESETGAVEDGKQSRKKRRREEGS